MHKNEMVIGIIGKTHRLKEQAHTHSRTRNELILLSAIANEVFIKIKC